MRQHCENIVLVVQSLWNLRKFVNKPSSPRMPSFNENRSQWGTYLRRDITCLFYPCHKSQWKKTIEQGATICFCWKAGFNATKNIWNDSESLWWVCCTSCYSVSLVQRIFRRVRVDSWWAEKWMTNDDKNVQKHCLRSRYFEGRSVGLRVDSAERIGIPKTIVQQILREDLLKWKLWVRFVPYALTAKQKEQHLNHAYDLIEPIKNNPNFWPL